MDDKWILNDNNEPVQEPDLLKWGQWFQHNRERRIIKQEETKFYYVSTVFLALDHNWQGGPPILFETMTFEREHVIKPEMKAFGHVLPPMRIREEVACERWTTWDQAVAGHNATVDRIKEWERIAEETAP